MTALVAQAVVMPTWVFLLLFIGGIALITFLLWANHEQAFTIRKQGRQIRRLERRDEDHVSLLRDGDR